MGACSELNLSSSAGPRRWGSGRFGVIAVCFTLWVRLNLCHSRLGLCTVPFPRAAAPPGLGASLEFSGAEQPLSLPAVLLHPRALLRGTELGQPLRRLLACPAKCVFSGKCGWNASRGCCGNLAARPRKAAIPVAAAHRLLRPKVRVGPGSKGCCLGTGLESCGSRLGWGKSRCNQVQTNPKVCVLSSA